MQAASWVGPTNTDGSCFAAYTMQGTILTFTGSASTDTITTPTAHAVPSEGIPVAFQALGASFPGGLNEGQIYHAYNRTTFTLQPFAEVAGTAQTGATTNGSAIVTGLSSTASLLAGDKVEGIGITAGTGILTVDSGTQITLTANATTTGSPTLKFWRLANITSDGAGTFYGEVKSLSKFNCDWFLLHTGSVSGLSGLYLNIQQQSRLNDLRVNSSLAPTDGTVQVYLKGQQAEFYDMELVLGATGLLVAEGGKFFDFYGCNVESHAVSGLAFDNALSIGFFGMHMEEGNAPVQIDIRSGGVQALKLSRIRGSISNGTYTALKVNSTGLNSATFTIDNWDATGSSSTAKLVDDVIRGFSFTCADLPGSAQGAYLMPHYVQVQGGNSPTVGWNGVKSVTAAYTTKIIDETIFASAAGAAFTVTLPSAANITGKKYTIKRTNSGVNNVTVGTTSSQTIDLPGGSAATTRTLGAQYAFITVVSDGANWMISAMGGTVT